MIFFAFPAGAQINRAYDSVTHIDTFRFASGKISRTCEWKETGRAHDFHVIDYYWNGNKESEYSERYGIPYDTSRYWDNKGRLESMEIYSDSGYISMIYDSSGLIRERGEYVLPQHVHNTIHIVDSLKNIDYHSKPIEYGTFVPYGVWTTYHTNGKLESIGRYLPDNFEGAEYGYDTVTNNCYPAGTIILYTISTETRLRDGTWHYYDNSGKEIRKEFYEGGVLRKTIEFQ